jgi:hypothetical protein
MALLTSSWKHGRLEDRVEPETILRWYRTGFRLFWRHRSKSRNDSRLAPEKIDLIRDMAKRNRLWGAERIRGELLKLGARVSKRYYPEVHEGRSIKEWRAKLGYLPDEPR